mmetsp:Transcript_112896/g.324476  ORF Transcript_112896/g.324476 Transcript_112896/m.324476 type:complete len:394 (+) Transcript_112896:200-1381(+)
MTCSSRERVQAYPRTFDNRAAGASLQQLPRLEQVLGSWRKVKTLGSAQFGKVVLAAGTPPAASTARGSASSSGDPGADAFVAPADLPEAFALKVMPRAAVLDGGSGIESASNELLAALYVRERSQHLHHIAKVLFVAQDDRFFYLATEYCPHGELLAVVRQASRFQNRVLREVMSQVLEAVKALHEQGIVHRDISLENVVVTATGSVRIIDFGQAMLVHDPFDENTEEMVQPSPAGSPGKRMYRAPELTAEPALPYYGKKVDMFAVGVMLFALAFGMYPAPEVYAEDPQASRCRCLRASLKKQGVLDRAAPEVVDLLEQLLAPLPAARPTAAEALVHPWITGTKSQDIVAAAAPAPAKAAPSAKAAAHAPGAVEAPTQWEMCQIGHGSEWTTF